MGKDSLLLFRSCIVSIILSRLLREKKKFLLFPSSWSQSSKPFLMSVRALGMPVLSWCVALISKFLARGLVLTCEKSMLFMHLESLQLPFTYEAEDQRCLETHLEKSWRLLTNYYLSPQGFFPNLICTGQMNSNQMTYVLWPPHFPLFLFFCSWGENSDVFLSSVWKNRYSFINLPRMLMKDVRLNLLPVWHAVAPFPSHGSCVNVG